MIRTYLEMLTANLLITTLKNIVGRILPKHVDDKLGINIFLMYKKILI
jgi:hypothetical protein